MWNPLWKGITLAIIAWAVLLGGRAMADYIIVDECNYPDCNCPGYNYISCGTCNYKICLTNQANCGYPCYGTTQNWAANYGYCPDGIWCRQDLLWQGNDQCTCDCHII